MKLDLSKLSRRSLPSKTVCVGNRLHDSNLGAIYCAKYQDSEVPYILKTIELNEQNVYAVVLGRHRTTLRGCERSKVLLVTEHKSDAREFQDTFCKGPLDRLTTVCKVVYVEDALQRDQANKLILVNEYLNEAIVGLVLSHFVKLPNIVRTHETWIEHATGFLFQDYAGSSLQKHMSEFSLDEFKSLVLQVFATLAMAQERTEFKHHDVHLENVFFSRVKPGLPILDAFPGAADATCWAYPIQTRGTTVYLKVHHQGILARLGDFGLAAITDPETSTRYERVDYPILDAGDQEWGSWNGHVKDHESYDALSFLSKFFLEQERGLAPTYIVNYAQDLYVQIRNLIEAKTGQRVESTVYGRPFRGHEGRLRISELLAIDAFQPYLVSERPMDAFVFDQS